MTLSIVVITMNRAEQLRSALLSCIRSNLPKDVEFIIVDNASTDNTEPIVKQFFEDNQFSFVYERETVNLGVGGGRNRGFDLARGEIVYFLDDDAVVSPDSFESFFKCPVSLFQQDSTIASITTRIYDEVLECDRSVIFSKACSKDSIPEIFMFLGGSHFLRKCYFRKPLYLDFKYGMEELLPSIFAIDSGLKNVYLHQISVLHQPKRNKWKSGVEEKNDIVVDYIVNNYVSKRLIYPIVFSPILFIAFICRTLYYSGFDTQMLRKIRAKLQSHKTKKIERKVRVNTVLSIIRDYSVGSAF